MNEHMQALAHLIEKHSGFINKYMGDAIMAVFGYPMINTTEAGLREDADNGVRCALDMGEATAPAERKIGEGRARAGANACRNFQRTGGGRLHRQHRTAGSPTATGNTVNTAARLESFAKDYATDDLCRTLIGDPTFELLDGKFPTEFVQTIQFERQRREDYDLPHLRATAYEATHFRRVSRGLVCFNICCSLAMPNLNR